MCASVRVCVCVCVRACVHTTVSEVAWLCSDFQPDGWRFYTTAENMEKMWKRNAGVFSLVSSSPSCKWVPMGDKTTVCVIIYCSALLGPASGVCYSTGPEFTELYTGTPVFAGGGGGARGSSLPMCVLTYMP